MKHRILTIVWRIRNERGFVARLLARCVVAALIATTFVALAWRVNPGPTQAAEPEGAAPAQTDRGRDAPAIEAGSLGSLVGRDAILRMRATPRGPRYSLWTKTGQLIGSDLFEEELRYLAPSLAPGGLFASPAPGAAQILADTPEID